MWPLLSSSEVSALNGRRETDIYIYIHTHMDRERPQRPRNIRILHSGSQDQYKGGYQKPWFLEALCFCGPVDPSYLNKNRNLAPKGVCVYIRRPALAQAPSRW